MVDDRRKLQITANSALAAAWGFNYYLKYYCNSSVHWSGKNINLNRNSLPVVKGKVKIRKLAASLRRLYLHELKPPEPADKFVLTYCGTLNVARHPEPLFRALQLFCNKHPELPKHLEVRLVGTAIGLDLTALIHYYRLENLVKPMGYLSHLEALRQVIGSDALLMFITSEEKKVQEKMNAKKVKGTPVKAEKDW